MSIYDYLTSGLDAAGVEYVSRAKRAAIGMLDADIRVTRHGPALSIVATTTILGVAVEHLSDPFTIRPDDRGLDRALAQVLTAMRDEYIVAADRLESLGDPRATFIRTELGLLPQGDESAVWQSWKTTHE